MGENINVVFAATSYGPHWAPAVASWLRAVAYASRYFTITLGEDVAKLGGAGITDRMYTMTAENTLVEEMLKEPSFTHMFSTEMDMILPHDAIVKLVQMDRDLATGVYFLRSDIPEGRGQPCLYKRAPGFEWRKAKEEMSEYLHSPVTMFPSKDPFKVDCAGLGCLLIKRKVFETVPYPWFDMRVGKKREIGYGSDIFFAKRVKDHGFELWVDPTVQCGQIDYYVTDIEDYKWQLDNNPGFAGRGFIIGAGEQA